MQKAVAIRAGTRYRLWLRFADGVEGEVDLADLAGRGVFAAWDEPGSFQAVRIGEFGQIEWGGGLEMCADSLWLRLTGKTPDQLLDGLSEPSKA